MIGQSFAHPFPDEVRLLGLGFGLGALVREVALMSGDRPLILARSVLPVRTLQGPGRRLARLGTRPLGEILFSCRSFQRSRFEPARADVCVWRSETRARFDLDAPVWGRRSVYSIGGRALLVAEFFLPALLSVTEPA